MRAGKHSAAGAPTCATQPSSAAGLLQKTSTPAPPQRKAHGHADTIDPMPVQLQGRGMPGQNMPGQKRKGATNGLQQGQKVKQQRVVYNEFSTSTESTTESDCTARSVQNEDASPKEQPANHTKSPDSQRKQQPQQGPLQQQPLKEQQQQLQQYRTPASNTLKLVIAPAVRHHVHAPCPDKDLQIEEGGPPAGSDQRVSGASGLRAYSRARRDPQAQKPPAAAITAKAAVHRAQQPPETGTAHVVQPQGIAALSKMHNSAVQVPQSLIVNQSQC